MRDLSEIIIGGNPEKLLTARKKLTYKVPVAAAGYVNMQLGKGRGIEAQNAAGNWIRIYRYFTKDGVGYGAANRTGNFFAVENLREVAQ